ncbi:MAG: hypothetical protein Q8P82_02945, partial [bacterium]|nr:hypothetical protein [bacterium]
MAASERMLGQQGAMSPEEVDIVVSDLHLSAGERLRIRPRFSLGAAFRRILRRSHAADQSFLDRENKLEDFPYDDAFSRMLDRVREQYGTVPRIRLRLMGDCFDPLVIPWKGKFSDPPYEAIAARKMQHILKGHRAFFAALARFIRTPNGYLDIFVGNHDVFLVWPGVQRQIARWLAGNNEALRKKIRFIDQHKRFEDFHRGVLFYHGMNADAHNAVDPERVILRERLGVKRKIPVHNMPYGSYMVVDLVNRIKLRNPLVGRLRGREMWKTAAIHMWSWGIYAGFAMMLTFLRSHLFAISDIRRTRSVRQFFRMVYETCIDGSPERVDRMAEHILEDRPDVRVVVLGHSHAWRRISTPKGTYL